MKDSSINPRKFQCTRYLGQRALQQQALTQKRGGKGPQRRLPNPERALDLRNAGGDRASPSPTRPPESMCDPPRSKSPPCLSSSGTDRDHTRKASYNEPLNDRNATARSHPRGKNPEPVSNPSARSMCNDQANWKHTGEWGGVGALEAGAEQEQGRDKEGVQGESESKGGTGSSGSQGGACRSGGQGGAGSSGSQGAGTGGCWRSRTGLRRSFERTFLGLRICIKAGWDQRRLRRWRRAGRDQRIRRRRWRGGRDQQRQRRWRRAGLGICGPPCAKRGNGSPLWAWFGNGSPLDSGGRGQGLEPSLDSGQGLEPTVFSSSFG